MNDAKMDWFKLYCEARNDAKLRALPDDQFRVWFNLLCYAAEQEERGTIPVIPPRLLAAEVANNDPGLLRSTLESLVELQMIALAEGGEILFLAWHKRQRRKPSDEPEAVAARVAKHRESRRETPQPAPAETPVTPCNAPVTPRNAIELEKEREIIYTALVHNSSAPGFLQKTGPDEPSPADENTGDLPALPETPGDPPPAPPAPRRAPRTDPDAVPRELLRAFRTARYPSKPADSETEWRAFTAPLRAAARAGVTPERVSAATRTALRRWSRREMVNPRSVLAHLDALEEPDEPARASPAREHAPTPREEMRRRNLETVDSWFAELDTALDAAEKRNGQQPGPGALLARSGAWDSGRFSQPRV